MIPTYQKCIVGINHVIKITLKFLSFLLLFYFFLKLHPFSIVFGVNACLWMLEVETVTPLKALIAKSVIKDQFYKDHEDSVL